MALSIGDLSLRTVNFVFLVIILGLSGSLAATADNNNPQVNFVVFAAAWGLLTSTFYGIAAYFISALAWPILLATFDFLNFVFLFSGATALAVAIRTHSCSNQSYLDSNGVTQGSSDRCRKAQATVAFSYFSFFVFTAALFFSVLAVFKNGLFGSSISRGTPRTGVPTMSQV
ncbi:hypothetical protein PP7435_CHR4-0473 [Komagataella phaffii CBS 7435]|uniref:MARVEL domain-containing protein n=2 Tax=Komagataella phaffii TaxID=460519 RepID=C4R835_KOMPG|nr:uncharacterized protein PAS_chr4_0504 [Komagataella phaffii GS115]AOA64982.1 GQ67_04871T0 [Komagataella phaffii]CAH2450849.1 hypothetical protein BQ9382_C4-2460 [Komagataella phaffii CBS 7435]AOA69498.1 GQ68_04843T0 [Komagataella phaffii GS115]CAY71760.1 Protein of unknown function [Komagataella phaffii GS115]CCA40639.1 hypothetical protein PP7435_CHR4-0473 [Komagataella phaffii CBS 7435]